MNNEKRNQKKSKVIRLLLLVLGYWILISASMGIFIFLNGLTSGIQMSTVRSIIVILIYVTFGIIIIWTVAKLKENWQIILRVTAIVFSILYGGIALVMHVAEISYHLSNLGFGVMKLSFFFSAILSLIVGFGLILYQRQKKVPGQIL